VRRPLSLEGASSSSSHSSCSSALPVVDMSSLSQSLDAEILSFRRRRQLWVRIPVRSYAKQQMTATLEHADVGK